jgi:hypothetical protein
VCVPKIVEPLPGEPGALEDTLAVTHTADSHPEPDFLWLEFEIPESDVPAEVRAAAAHPLAWALEQHGESARPNGPIRWYVTEDNGKTIGTQKVAGFEREVGDPVGFTTRKQEVFVSAELTPAYAAVSTVHELYCLRIVPAGEWETTQSTRPPPARLRPTARSSGVLGQ